MRDFEWHRSSFCASGACVEVAVSEFGDVLVSDSKLGDASPFRGFSSGAWARVLEDIRDGFLPDGVTLPTYGTVAWGVLEFTGDEWDAFVAGVKAGEFDYDRLSGAPGPHECGDELSSGDEAGSGFRGVARSGHAATGAGGSAVPPVPVAAQSLACTHQAGCPVHGDVRDCEPARRGCYCAAPGCWSNPCKSLPAGESQAGSPAPGEFCHRHFSWLCQAGQGQCLTATPAPVAAQPRYVLDAPAILDMVGRYAAACVEAATSGSPKGREGAREQIRDLWDAIRGALTPVPDVEPEPAWGSGPLVKHVTETPGQAVQS